MAENSKIEWTDATFNPWIGCTKVSAACDHCYAEALSKARLGVPWGAGQPRRRTTAENWKQPLRWNRKAAKEGRRMRVFCASLADVFDAEVPDAWRDELFALIAATPHLDWLLLTKRPNVMRKYLTSNTAERRISRVAPSTLIRPLPWPNVWLGTTVEDRAAWLARGELLKKTPAAVHFLSMEPLLQDVGDMDLCGIDWVITGGESGPGARPSHPDWFRSIRDQCQSAGVPFLFKQWGDWAPGANFPDHIPSGQSHDFGDDSLGDDRSVWRVGKKAAGRLLDGVEHNGYPAVR